MSARDTPLDALQQEQITYWLSMWHAWSRASVRCAQGYNCVSAGFGGYRAAGRWGNDNGDLDAAADAAEALAVDAVIQRMSDPWRTALHVEARNVDSPAHVWRSARIEQARIAEITSQARRMLWDGMAREFMA